MQLWPQSVCGAGLPYKLIFVNVGRAFNTAIESDPVGLIANEGRAIAPNDKFALTPLIGRELIFDEPISASEIAARLPGWRMSSGLWGGHQGLLFVETQPLFGLPM